MHIRRLAPCAAAVVLAFLAGVPAHAATRPPWQAPPADPDNVGTLAFYDAAGNPITSGSLSSSPMAAKVVATGLTGYSGDVKAQLFAATPDDTADPGDWQGAALSGQTIYGDPNHPTVTGAGGDFSLGQYVSAYPNTSTAAGYANVYELQLAVCTGTNDCYDDYASADVTVDTASGTWTEVYGTGVNDAPSPTSVAVTASASSVAHGGSAVLTVTTPAGLAGTVSLHDGSSPAPSGAVSDSSNVTHFTVSPRNGSHSYTATFTPWNTRYAPSTSAPVVVSVTQYATQLAASLSPASVAYGKQATLKVTASASATPTGVVTVLAGGKQIASATLSGGTAAVKLPTTLAVGKAQLTVAYSGDADDAPATAAASLGVAKAKVTEKASVRNGRLVVKVTGQGFTPSGTVTVKAGGRRVARGTLKRGSVTLSLAKLPAGVHKVTVSYGGSKVATAVSATSRI